MLGDDLRQAGSSLLSAGGRRFGQSLAHELAAARHRHDLRALRRDRPAGGRHPGRAKKSRSGTIVLTGGELPAMVVADAVIRLVPGVIDAASIAEESHGDPDEPSVEYPNTPGRSRYRGHDRARHPALGAPRERSPPGDGAAARERTRALPARPAAVTTEAMNLPRCCDRFHPSLSAVLATPWSRPRHTMPPADSARLRSGRSEVAWR